MPTVLMVEDNDADRRLVELLLASSFDLLYASSLTQAYEILTTQTPAVILLDLNLPDSRGMDTISELVKRYPKIPIVVWSGAGDITEAIHRGAEDFILKNGNLTAVEKALSEAIQRHKFTDVRQDIKAIQKMIEKEEP